MMTALHLREEILSVGRIYQFDFSQIDEFVKNLPEPYRYRGWQAAEGRPLLLDIENTKTGRRSLYLMDGFYGVLVPVRNLYEGKSE